MTITAFPLAGVVALASWRLTKIVLEHARANGLLDVPNVRSSHTVPTPRGGGAALAVALLGGLVFGAALGLIPWRMAVAFGGGGIAVAAVGWRDDVAGVRPVIRAAVHCFAALWALIWLGGISSIAVGPFRIQLGIAGQLLVVLGIAWCVNLYNFMDGIDGIAAGEAVIVGAVGALLLAISGGQGPSVVSLLVAAASAGFLMWNWCPARIFMGDAGSGLLGFWFGALAVASERSGGPPILVWAILLGAFGFDATLTLARRVARGEPWYRAHRQHAYQRAVQSGLTHRRVTTLVLALGVLLAGLAFWQTRDSARLTAALVGGVILTAAYLWVERRQPMTTRYAREPSTIEKVKRGQRFQRFRHLAASDRHR